MLYKDSKGFDSCDMCDEYLVIVNRNGSSISRCFVWKYIGVKKFELFICF